MKTASIILICSLCILAPIYSAQAQCIVPHAFGSHDYHYIMGIPDGAPLESIKSIFYAYDYDEDPLDNGTYDREVWFINREGFWYSAGDWCSNGVTGCPLDLTTDHVQIVSYDNDLSTADNDVTFAVLGVPWNVATSKFDFDQITDGITGTLGGGPCCVPLQSIPSVTIGSISGSVPPYQVELSWSEPAYNSFGVGSHGPYTYGYRVYYALTDDDTPPTSNETGWTLVDGGDLVSYGSGGATVTMNSIQVHNQALWFALRVVGIAHSSTAGESLYESAFVGRAANCYYHYYPVFPAPDGTAPSEPVRATKLDDMFEIDWDSTTCPAEGYHIVLGRLENVSSYTIEQEETICYQNDPVTTSLPEYDLFFLVIGRYFEIYDPYGWSYVVESSWGKDSDGIERAGFTPDETCFDPIIYSKDSSPTCP
ncbi:hypothetical protein JXQ70_16780 [bacterium]|nr:hypothetical protein [bacterium]